MKIAITAVSGQLGTAISKEAVEIFGKENIVGTARNPKKVKNIDIPIFEADYNEKEGFLNAFEGIDAVLLISGMDKPENRIQQHRNVIDAAKEKGVKKIVYTSIIGESGNSTFDPIVKANRQTEEDIKKSGLEYAIGRNGLYIEPDLDYLNNYIEEGKISNSAGSGKCSYTSRKELALAYTYLLKKNNLNGGIYNLCGEAITQTELVENMNAFFDTHLKYESLTPVEYTLAQYQMNGEFFGNIIAGIYQKIRNNEFNVESDYKMVTGINHQSIQEMMQEHKNE